MAKHNSSAPVEDKAREREVVFAAIRLGVKKGVDPEVVLKVFTAQIEASKIAQRHFLASWPVGTSFANTPNLARDIRPKLDALTPVILDGLRRKRYWSESELRFRLAPEYWEAWQVATRPLRSRPWKEVTPQASRSQVPIPKGPCTLNTLGVLRD